MKKIKTKINSFLIRFLFLVEEMNFADKIVVEKTPVEKWIRPFDQDNKVL